MDKVSLVLRDGQNRSVSLNLRQESHSDPLAGEVKFWQLGLPSADFLVLARCCLLNALKTPIS